MARILSFYILQLNSKMKIATLSALIAILISLSSCKNETVYCTPGNADVYGLKSLPTTLSSKVVVYDAMTRTAIDSSGAYLSEQGRDTVLLFNMRQGREYKLFLNDSTSYFINNITLSGLKQQTIKTSIINTKGYGCIERIISYDLNGTRQDISGNKEDRIYLK
jgi:hypothetical protein